ncbi:carbonate dehydratase [Noviherbaspirillum sp. CPCC 100848]|uniref:carbonic anhydrase n=1 Tax=Noviherbaspirillum album TaxID=3080276 RepID=A0ABU6J9H0_9BURK|nr:carbonate dehydratase [Noviherbaspirillum sp. CPCC 100848]MEC4720294.1 carbonate dehydratase [Noviherbaspirillum sp. CPCC 100848]
MNSPKPTIQLLEQLFDNNRSWAASMVATDDNFFKTLARQQSPEYLWIGCADSRVPANEIVGLLPGELFVHRNIANVVVHSDLNCLSVLQFAIDVLKVKHIIVCGHYGCSGVHAALARRRVGLADNWLRHVQDVHQKHERYLGDALPAKIKQDRLCELNVLEQVINVCQTTVVQDAWERGQELTVHSWIYGLQDGLLRDLGLTMGSIEDLGARMAGILNRYDEERGEATEAIK